METNILFTGLNMNLLSWMMLEKQGVFNIEIFRLCCCLPSPLFLATRLRHDKTAEADPWGGAIWGNCPHKLLGRPSDKSVPLIDAY